MPSQNPILTERARQLRVRQTAAESLLWQMMRGRRLCGLKFRRQYPIQSYIVDFACRDKRLVIEIDGEYHDHIYDRDKVRQKKLEADGWRVVRFGNEDVLSDVNAVAVAIARLLDLEDELGF